MEQRDASRARDNGSRNGGWHGKQSVAHDMRICLSVTLLTMVSRPGRKLRIAQLNNGLVSMLVN
jgi:hypothetical protein